MSIQRTKNVVSAPMFELESSAADLEIVLDDDVQENGGKCDNSCTKATNSILAIRRYPSAVVASHSKYVDTMLKTEMKEKRTKRIHFPDISVELWDLLWSLKRDACRARHMTVEDALAVAPVSDKYEFPVGQKLCNAVLADYLEDLKNKTDWGDSCVDVNQVVEVLEVARLAKLETATAVGEAFLRRELKAAATKKEVLAVTHFNKVAQEPFG